MYKKAPYSRLLTCEQAHNKIGGQGLGKRWLQDFYGWQDPHLCELEDAAARVYVIENYIDHDTLPEHEQQLLLLAA